jgi:hypothetical protein
MYYQSPLDYHIKRKLHHDATNDGNYVWCALILISLSTSDIVAVNVIGGGNPCTQRKPPTCHKSLTNFFHIMLYRVHREV